MYIIINTIYSKTLRILFCSVILNKSADIFLHCALATLYFHFMRESTLSTVKFVLYRAETSREKVNVLLKFISYYIFSYCISSTKHFMYSFLPFYQTSIKLWYFRYFQKNIKNVGRRSVSII